MKTMQKLVSFAALAMLTMSCSDMDSVDSLSQNAPADFDANIYAELNPDVAYYQIRDAVKSKNDLSGIKTGSEAFTADTADFFADTAWMHVLVTDYIGYADSLWTGSPDKGQRRFLLEYNQLGKSVSDDRAYVESFTFDQQTLMFHFGIVGQKEGRPYKICEDGHYGAERDPAVHAQNPSDKIPDYRPNLFCALDNHIYLIQ